MPLKKISKFQDLFEENAVRLTDYRGMLDYIPFIRDVMLYFADIEPFLRENEDLDPNLRSKLLAFFDNLHITSKLRVEAVDWREQFVKACYRKVLNLTDIRK